MKIKEKGFTLVELLVVIGILGILASALLAAIDPIEQINKAQDTAKRTLVVEFIGGLSRFYGSAMLYPWDIPVGAGGCPNPPNGAPFTHPSVGTCLGTIINSGEIKASFDDNQVFFGDLSFVRVTATEPPKACFLPESKAYKNDPLAIYNSQGQTGICTIGVNCYWCAQ